MTTVTLDSNTVQSFDGTLAPDVDRLELPTGVHNLTIPWNTLGGVGLTVIPNGFVGVWPEFSNRVAIWTIQDRDSFSGKGMGIQGPKPVASGFGDVLKVAAREGQCAVNLARVKNIDIEQWAVCNVWGDFFRVDQTTLAKFVNNYGHEAGRHGIAVVQATEIWAIANHFNICHRWGCATDPNGNYRSGKLTFAYNYVRTTVGLVSGADNYNETVIGANDGPF